jgi:SAM-dependent methyltransferase
LGYFIKNGFLFIRGIYYKGDSYSCPVCEGRFRKFLPGGFDLPVLKQKQVVGGGFRENLICPRCLSTDRDRLIMLFLKQKSDFFTKPNKVLHIAPEPSLYKIFKKSENLDYVPGTKYLEGFYYSNKLLSLDVTSLPFDDDTFDYVIANHLLEHIKDDHKAMREIHRVLKPEGKAILQVPIALALEQTYENNKVQTPKERERHFGQFDHVRLYGKDYAQRLEKAGFKVVKYKPGTPDWPMEHPDIYALNKNEYLYVAFKTRK